jgi:hypothetical protein
MWMTSGRDAFVAQGHALMNAKSMLLVYDDKAKSIELHALLKQGMCADNEFRTPI